MMGSEVPSMPASEGTASFANLYRSNRILSLSLGVSPGKIKYRIYEHHRLFAVFTRLFELPGASHEKQLNTKA